MEQRRGVGQQNAMRLGNPIALERGRRGLERPGRMVDLSAIGVPLPVDTVQAVALDQPLVERARGRVIDRACRAIDGSKVGVRRARMAAAAAKANALIIKAAIHLRPKIGQMINPAGECDGKGVARVETEEKYPGPWIFSATALYVGTDI